MNRYDNDSPVEFIECYFCKRHTPKPRARQTTIHHGGETSEVLTCRNCNIIANDVDERDAFTARMLCSVTRLLWEKSTREADRLIQTMDDIANEFSDSEGER